jgi:hypothetical protein
VCCYIQYHQLRGYDALEFEVGCLGLYTLWHYYKLEITYENYYCCHQTLTSNRPTFAMTQIKIVPYHVKNRTKDQLEKLEQVMNNCQELTCFIDVADLAMASIIWRSAKNELTKHLGINKLSLRVAILRTRHLVEKLSKWPHVGKIIHY